MRIPAKACACVQVSKQPFSCWGQTSGVSARTRTTMAPSWVVTTANADRCITPFKAVRFLDYSTFNITIALYNYYIRGGGYCNWRERTASGAVCARSGAMVGEENAWRDRPQPHRGPGLRG